MRTKENVTRKSSRGIKLLACGLLLLAIGTGVRATFFPRIIASKDSIEPNITDAPANRHPSKNNGSPPPRRSPQQTNEKISLARQLAGVSWIERQSIVRNALKNRTETPEAAWEAFLELESNSSDKIGPSGVALDMFSEFANIDPFFAIACLETLEGGIVRERALLGLTSEIPAYAALKLHASIVENGYPEEVKLFQDYLLSSARKYSAEELRMLIDSEILEGDSKAAVESYLKDRESGSSIGDSRKDDTSRGEFEKQLSNNPFEVANRLITGELKDVVLTEKLTSDLSKILVYEDPKKAFEWATLLQGENREYALQAVTSSWIRLDPANCSNFISNQHDLKIKSTSAIEISRYLIERQSRSEASAWTNFILDPQTKHDIMSEISNSK